MLNKKGLALVSIIIPTYGRADMLERAIDSVLKQTYKNIEIIIVNDNPKKSESYKRTMKVLDKYSTIDKIKIFADGINRGGSLARNKGIEISEGEFITFLDDDDYYYSEKIAKQLEVIQSNNSDVCVCNMDHEIKGKIVTRLDGKAIIGDIANFILRGRTFTPMIFLKREIIYSVGKFTHAQQFQDHILMLKILESKFKVSIIDQSLFVHNVHFGERITKNRIVIGNYKVRRLYEKNLLKFLNNKQIKDYYFIYYLTNARYYRDEKDFRCFFENILLSLNYVFKPIHVFEACKVFISYFLK